MLRYVRSNDYSPEMHKVTFDTSSFFLFVQTNVGRLQKRGTQFTYFVPAVLRFLISTCHLHIVTHLHIKQHFRVKPQSRLKK